MPAFPSSPAYSQRRGYVASFPTPEAPVRRLSVFDVFQRHILCLSALPGEVSQFEETGVGYEWRCQLTLQEAIVRNGAYVDLSLQFSLLDLEGRIRPTPVLYLVEQAANGQERLFVALSDMDTIVETLNKLLLPRGASIAAVQLAGSFVDALSAMRQAVGTDVDWS